MSWASSDRCRAAAGRDEADIYLHTALIGSLSKKVRSVYGVIAVCHVRFFDARKMIVSQFIKAVHIGRDYNIEVDFNVSFDELQKYCISDSKHNNMQAPESRTA